MARKKKQARSQRRDGAPLISVCMIVRDEEANLERCLRSVRPVADEIVVVDTGSRDNTVEIARRSEARVAYFEWCDDFAAARNAALEQAAGRWILQMDADEELTADSARLIRRVVSGAPKNCWGFFIKVRSHIVRDGCRLHTIGRRMLLFRNRPDLRYEGRIHEHIAYVGGGTHPEFSFCDDLMIDHYGYLPDQMTSKGKDERNLRLLQRAVEEYPDDPFQQFNLGLFFHTADRFADAVVPLQRAVSLCRNVSTNYLPTAYAMLVVALARVGRVTEMLETLAEAERRLPKLIPDFYHNAGVALAEIGDHDQALKYFQRALDTGSVRIAAESDPGTYTWLPRVGKGKIYEARGQFELARACYEEALAYVPEHPELICRLASVELALAYPQRALEHLKLALQLDDVPEQAWKELLQICERLKDRAANAPYLVPDLDEVGREVVRRAPLSPALGAKLASVCVRFGQFERGIAAANASLERGEDLLALVNRGRCYFAVGRYQEAADDFAAAQAVASKNQDAAADVDFVQQSLAQGSGVRSLGLDEVSLEHSPAVVGGESLVSIVVPVCRSVERTRCLLQAVIENTPDDLYEVVVVDDASGDGTADFLRLLSGDVKIITNQTSVGYIRACNQGASAATGKYLVFLSNDTEPRKGWLEGLIALAENDASVGAVGGRLLYSDGRLRQAGGAVLPDGAFRWYGEGTDPADPKCDLVREVDFCSAVALLVRRDLWNEIGGFDPAYAVESYAAADLCLAIREAGYRVLYQPATEVIHHEEAA